MSTAWQLEFDGDKRPLKDWGIQSFTFTRRNLDADELVLQLAGDLLGTEEHTWAYKDKLVLWYNTERRFTGWVTALPTLGRAETHQYVVSGPWWWLTQIPYKASRWISSGYGEPVYVATTKAVANYDSSTNEVISVQAEITRAVESAIGAGAPIAIGTIDAAFKTPLDLVKGKPCSDVIRSATKFVPSHVFWWDYSDATPTCNCKARADLDALDIDLLGGAVEDYQLTPRHDLKIEKVRIVFEYPEKGNDKVTAYYNDVAGDLEWPDGPGLLETTITLGSYQEFASLFVITMGTPPSIAQKVYNALKDLQYEGAIQLRHTSSDLPVIAPGNVINFLSGISDWETMNAVVQESALTHQPNRRDTLRLTFGPPNHLGPQDYLTIANIGPKSDTEDDDKPVKSASGGTASGLFDPSPNNYGDLIPPDLLLPNAASFNVTAKQRGGTASLVGWEPFNGQTATPWQKYRRHTVGGTASANVYANTDCTGAIVDHTYDAFSGSSVYGRLTGTLTEGETYVQSVDSGVVSTTTNSTFTPGLGYAPLGDTSTASATHRASVAGSLCQNTGFNGVHRGTAACYEDLSEEDTNTDAEDRLELSLPAWEDISWGSYSGVSSLWQTRGASFSFNKYKAKGRVTGSGYYSLWEYNVKITFERRLASGGAWSDADVVNVAASASFSGDVDTQFDYPSVEGYEYRIKTAEFQISI